MKIIQIMDRQVNANNSELVALTDTGDVYWGGWDTDWNATGGPESTFSWYGRLPDIPEELRGLRPGKYTGKG
jgi:hypothetical protein